MPELLHSCYKLQYSFAIVGSDLPDQFNVTTLSQGESSFWESETWSRSRVTLCYWPGITYCTVNNIITVLCSVLCPGCPLSSQTRAQQLYCNEWFLCLLKVSYLAYVSSYKSCLTFCAFIHYKHDFATNKNITTCFLIFYDFRPVASAHLPPPPWAIFDNPVGRLKICSPVLGELGNFSWTMASNGSCKRWD